VRRRPGSRLHLHDSQERWVHLRTDTERSLTYNSRNVTRAIPTTTVAVVPLPPLDSLRSGGTAAAVFDGRGGGSPLRALPEKQAGAALVSILPQNRIK